MSNPLDELTAEAEKNGEYPCPKEAEACAYCGGKNALCANCPPRQRTNEPLPFVRRAAEARDHADAEADARTDSARKYPNANPFNSLARMKSYALEDAASDHDRETIARDWDIIDDALRHRPEPAVPCVGCTMGGPTSKDEPCEVHGPRGESPTLLLATGVLKELDDRIGSLKCNVLDPHVEELANILEALLDHLRSVPSSSEPKETK